MIKWRTSVESNCQHLLAHRKSKIAPEKHPSPGNLPNQGTEPMSPALLEKEMATHSSTLAWKILWMEEPGRLQSLGSQRVGCDWATPLSLFIFMHWRRNRQPTHVPAWRTPGMGEPGGLPSMGLHTAGHDWSNLAAAAAKPLTVWITTNCGRFFKRWEYQTTWPASWEISMQVRK